MRDRLLNYLFGQIDDQERSAIEDALARDPALRAELARLRECTQSPAAPSQLEPPSGLAERTCRYVSEAGDDEREPSGRYRIASDTWEQCTWSGTTKWSLVDLTLAAGVVLAAAVLLLPAMQESRHGARRLQCESNLAELGEAILAYMYCNHNQLPSVLDRGELTVDGSVPMQLVEAGLLDRRRAAQLVTCPGSRLWQQVRTQRVIVLIPTREQFQQDKPLVILGTFRTTMGGSLAFRAGYVRGNSYRPWQLEDGDASRSPIVSDGPSLYLADFQSDNHGGSRLNVLFADGRVKFISGSMASGDKLFLNKHRQRAPSDDPHDVVLLGSGQRLNLHFVIGRW